MVSSDVASRYLTRRMAALLLGATIFSACGSPVAAPPATESSGSAETPITPVATVAKDDRIIPPPTPDPAAPFHLSMTGLLATREPLTAEELVAQYDLIVTGRVQELLPAQWTTEDGTRPINPWESVPNQYTIITPAIIFLDAPPIVNRDRIPPDTMTLTVAYEGGRVGNDSVEPLVWTDRLNVGDHVLLALSDYRAFLANQRTMFATPRGPAWNLGMTYHLTADGKAISFLGTQSAADLLVATRSAAPSPSDGVTPTP